MRGQTLHGKKNTDTRDVEISYLFSQALMFSLHSFFLEKKRKEKERETKNRILGILQTNENHKIRPHTQDLLSVEHLHNFLTLQHPRNFLKTKEASDEALRVEARESYFYHLNLFLQLSQREN